MLNYQNFLNEKRDHRQKIKKFANISDIYEWSHDFDSDMALWIADKVTKEFKIRIQKDNPKLINELEKFLNGNLEDEEQIKIFLNYLNKVKISIKPKIRKVLDYVNSQLHIITGLPGSKKPNINKLSLKDAIKLCKDWHEEIKKNSDKFLIEDENGEIIKTYDDNFYWINLQTTNCGDEASAMGHCGRVNDATTLLSLRKYKQPHVTIGWDENNNNFTQIKGKGNTRPHEKYHSYIVDLICHLEINRLKSEYDRSSDFVVDDLIDDKLIDKLDKCNPNYVDNFQPMSYEELEEKYRHDLKYSNYELEFEYIPSYILWSFIDDTKYCDDHAEGEKEYYLDDFTSHFDSSSDEIINYIEKNSNSIDLNSILNKNLEEDLQEIRDDNDELDEEDLKELLDERKEKSNYDILDELYDFSNLEEILDNLDLKDGFVDEYVKDRYNSAEDVYDEIYGNSSNATYSSLKQYGFVDYIDEDEAIEWLVNNMDEENIRERYDE